MTKERSRLQWVVDDDQSYVLMLAPVLRVDSFRVVFLFAVGPYRAGFAWRRFA